MVGAEHTEYPADLDICDFTLNDYVPAKPLESNLEVVYTTEELVSRVMWYSSPNIDNFHLCRLRVGHVVS